MDSNSAKCPHTGCGHENRPGSRFCGRCGRPLSPPEFEVEWRWVWWWVAPVFAMFGLIWLTIAPVREFSPFFVLAFLPFAIFGVRRRNAVRRWWWRDQSDL